MNLNNLEKIMERSKKRVGRGIGSGKGKTGGRGTKGQKARGKIPAAFIGGSLPLYKKLPFVRGWGNKKANPKSITINMSDLSRLKANSEVSAETLIEAKLISAKQAKKRGIKVLEQGELTVRGLTVQLPVSKNAKSKIESAGGKVV